MTDGTSATSIRIPLNRRSAIIALVTLLIIVGGVIFYERATSSSSTNAATAKTLAQEGIAAFQAKDYQLCEQLFTQEIAAAATPNQKSIAYYNRGSTLVRLNRFPDAISDFQQATSLAPGFQMAWFNLALANQSEGHSAASLDAYNHVLRLNPHNVGSLLNSGVMIYRKGDHHEGLRRIKLAISLKPAVAAQVPSNIPLT